ncbi:MAG: hypothetical protein FWD05_13345 [Oscillospiraceae bacterium]|nr:hypothetical protein [Oscillospiraceae bacterium]
MEIKDVLEKNLKDKALSSALEIVDYLTEKGLVPIKEWATGFRFVKNEKSPCLMVINNGNWFLCDVPVVSEPEWGSLSNDLKAFIVANIKICNVHQGNPCGCGSEPGTTKTIFGKEYNNVCTSEIQFFNFTPAVLDKIKELIEWWLINIGN